MSASNLNSYFNLLLAYDRVPREIMSLGNKDRNHINSVNNLYDEVVSSVKTTGAKMSKFSITASLHQDTPLSQFSCALFSFELIGHVQEEVHDILFAI